MILFLLGRIAKKKNILGKEENAGYQHFLLFPQCFQKTSSMGVSKSWDYEGKGYMALSMDVVNRNQ